MVIQLCFGTFSLSTTAIYISIIVPLYLSVFVLDKSGNSQGSCDSFMCVEHHLEEIFLFIQILITINRTIIIYLTVYHSNVFIRINYMNNPKLSTFKHKETDPPHISSTVLKFKSALVRFVLIFTQRFHTHNVTLARLHYIAIEIDCQPNCARVRMFECRPFVSLGACGENEVLSVPYPAF